MLVRAGRLERQGFCAVAGARWLMYNTPAAGLYAPHSSISVANTLWVVQQHVAFDSSDLLNRIWVGYSMAVVVNFNMQFLLPDVILLQCLSQSGFGTLHEGVPSFR